MKKDRVGEEYVTNEGYKVKIVEYFNNTNCTIKFENDYIKNNVMFNNIKKGNIRNPFHRSVHGEGYIGLGRYKAGTKVYDTWNAMLRRSYYLKYSQINLTYKDVIVCEEWHNFQNFGEWFDKNYTEDWHLDKDILVKGNKIYSPETCCFVPQEINKIFIKHDKARGKFPIGVNKHGKRFQSSISTNSEIIHLGTFDTIEEAFEAYKTAKESYIKETAEKYKSQITLKCYKALINYNVEITD